MAIVPESKRVLWQSIDLILNHAKKEEDKAGIKAKLHRWPVDLGYPSCTLLAQGGEHRVALGDSERGVCGEYRYFNAVGWLH